MKKSIEEEKLLPPDQYISYKYQVSNEEYQELMTKFGKLCYYVAHQLKKNNTKNNYSDDVDDINQDLVISLVKAGSYYKRQMYIESCLLHTYKIKDEILKKTLKKLRKLWKNRTKHGASRQKFGSYHEEILEKIVQTMPEENRPPYLPLKIDSTFATYCKAIIWNTQKAMGKRITREKSIRVGQVSLSDNKHLT
jgi:hypothetical protein